MHVPRIAGRQLEEISLGDAVSVHVEDNNDSDVDKSIVDVSVIQPSESTISMSINFADTSAISREITEPDILVIDFSDPGIIKDKDSGKPFAVDSFTRKITIGR